MVEADVVAEQIAQERQHCVVVEEIAEHLVPAQELVAETLAVDPGARRHQPLGPDDCLHVLDVARRQDVLEHQVAVEVEEVALLGGQAVGHPPIVSAPAPLRGQAARMASTLSSILIFLPTSRPPLSSTTFQPRPQSSRLTSVAAENPMRWSPKGLFSPPSNSTCRTTDLVTSRMARSPVTS